MGWTAGATRFAGAAGGVATRHGQFVRDFRPKPWLAAVEIMFREGLVDVLEKIALLLELKGENPFFELFDVQGLGPKI